MISPWSSNFDTNKVKIQPFHCNKTTGHSQFQTLLNYLKKPNKDKSQNLYKQILKIFTAVSLS